METSSTLADKLLSLSGSGDGFSRIQSALRKQSYIARRPWYLFFGSSHVVLLTYYRRLGRESKDRSWTGLWGTASHFAHYLRFGFWVKRLLIPWSGESAEARGSKRSELLVASCLAV